MDTHLIGSIMIVLYGISAGLTILTIGKPRKPLDPGTALLGLIITMLMIWGIVILMQAAA